MTKLIAIDDGHGMETAGKRTPIFPDGIKSPDTGKDFMHENEFNRAVAKILDIELRRNGFKTIFVAPTDSDTPLSERVAKANNMNADFYISVHANAYKGVWGTWGGAETFTYGSGEGLRIGKIIHKHLMKGTPLRDRGVKDGSWLYVIRNTKMPAVLIEAAFMDNLSEAKLLLSNDFRKETAREIAMGICEAYGINYVSEQASSSMYRVRLYWSDASTQKGAFTILDNAIRLADSLIGEGDYKVFNQEGNVVYDPTPEIEPVWYRVRKTWEDATTQIGAFHQLEGAKSLADSRANDGYKVFDENGVVVYTPKIEEAPVDLHDNHQNIEGKSVVSAEKMIAFVKEKNQNAQDIEDIANAFIRISDKYGIRGDVAFCQSILETGWFRFDNGTAVTPDQHNYCGLGAVSEGVKGHSFKTVEEGVLAQIQHLFAYAHNRPIPSGEAIIDPRFEYVTRGIAPHWEDLSNRWANNSNYGTDILSLYSQLLEFEYEIPETPFQQWIIKIIDYVFEKITELLGKST